MPTLRKRSSTNSFDSQNTGYNTDGEADNSMLPYQEIFLNLIEDCKTHISMGESKLESDHEAALINFMVGSNNLYTIFKTGNSRKFFSSLKSTDTVILQGITYQLSEYDKVEELIKELFSIISYLQDKVKSLISSGSKDKGNNKENDEDDLDKSCKERVKQKTFDPCKPNTVDYNQVIGLSQQKGLIMDGFAYPLVYPKLYPPVTKGMLFWGPPGTGKTYIMKATLNEIQRLDPSLGVLFYAPTGASMKSKWVGGTEKNIAAHFDCASRDAFWCQNNSNGRRFISIIFIDEVEAIAANRAEGGEQMTNSVNVLLQKMDGMDSYPNVAVVAATNYPWKLDSAILRRLPQQIYLPVPTKTDARQLVQLQIDIGFNKFNNYKKSFTVIDECLGIKKILPKRETARDKEEKKKNDKCPKPDGKAPNIDFKKKYNFRAPSSKQFRYMKKKEDVESGNIESLVNLATGVSGGDSITGVKGAPYSNSDISQFCNKAFSNAASRARILNEYFLTRIEDEVCYLSNFSENDNKGKTTEDIIVSNPYFEIKYYDKFIKKISESGSEEIKFWANLIKNRHDNSLQILYSTNQDKNSELKEFRIESEGSELQILQEYTAKLEELRGDKSNGTCFMSVPIPKTIKKSDLVLKSESVQASKGGNYTYNLELIFNETMAEEKIRTTLDSYTITQVNVKDNDEEDNTKVNIILDSKKTKDELETEIKEKFSNTKIKLEYKGVPRVKEDSPDFVRHIDYFKNMCFTHYFIDQYGKYPVELSSDYRKDYILYMDNYLTGISIPFLRSGEKTLVIKLMISNFYKNLQKDANLLDILRTPEFNNFRNSKVDLDKKDNIEYILKRLYGDNQNINEILLDEEKLFDFILKEIVINLVPISGRNIFLSTCSKFIIYEFNTNPSYTSSNPNLDKSNLDTLSYGVIPMIKVLSSLFSRKLRSIAYLKGASDMIYRTYKGFTQKKKTNTSLNDNSLLNLNLSTRDININKSFNLYDIHPIEINLLDYEEELSLSDEVKRIISDRQGSIEPGFVMGYIHKDDERFYFDFFQSITISERERSKSEEILKDNFLEKIKDYIEAGRCLLLKNIDTTTKSDTLLYDNRLHILSKIYGLTNGDSQNCECKYEESILYKHFNNVKQKMSDVDGVAGGIAGKTSSPTKEVRTQRGGDGFKKNNLTTKFFKEIVLSEQYKTLIGLNESNHDDILIMNFDDYKKYIETAFQPVTGRFLNIEPRLKTKYEAFNDTNKTNIQAFLSDQEGIENSESKLLQHF